MGLINWIFDIYQHTRIDEARNEAAAARAELAAVRGSVGGSVDGERLERALGQLALATKTVQRLLIDKGICTPAEFAEKLRAIDMEDGVQDGQSPLL